MFRIVTLAVGAVWGVLSSSDNSRSHLVDVYDAGDLAAVMAQAAVLTAADLRPAIAATPPALAALWAAPATIDGVALLPDLAVAARHWDHHVATTSALAARAIVRTLSVDDLETLELLPSEVEGWRAAFGALANDGRRRNDVRVIAAEVALELGRLSDTAAGNAASAAMLATFRASNDAELVHIAADLDALLPPTADQP